MLAALTQAHLFAIFVIDPVNFDRDLAAQMTLTGTEALQQLQPLAVAQELSVQTELKCGEPVREILAMSEAVQADLVVMAPHHDDFLVVF